MESDGNLLVKYEIPLNQEMHDAVTETIEKDNIVQWLASTPLKRDQFKFLYNMQAIIWGCALREEFCKLPFDKQSKLDKDPIFAKVIPELTVLHAMLVIRNIEDKKKADAEHDEKKKERMQKYIPQPTEEQKLEEQLR